MARAKNRTTPNPADAFPSPKAMSAAEPEAAAAEPEAAAAEPEAAAAEPEAVPATDAVSAGEAKRLSAIAADSATYLGAGTFYAVAPEAGQPFTVNPKRGKSRDRFALYRQGMTVAAFVAAGGKREDIPWDLKRGFIGLVGVRAGYYRDLAARGR